MIEVDKTDELYRYLTALGVENVEDEYISLAKSGRFKRADVQNFYRETFTPSINNDLDETELEKVVDYFVDLKKLKKVGKKSFDEMLKKYTASKDDKLKSQIMEAKLLDVLYMCLNYKSLHPDVDLQDLVQTANIGLMIALEKFKDSSRLKFDDFLVYHIRKKIIEDYEEKK